MTGTILQHWPCLNNHPAKRYAGYLYIQTNPDILLRTHTSNVQIRVMEKQEPQSGSSHGRTYRNETISARELICIFHQVELLYIDDTFHSLI